MTAAAFQRVLVLAAVALLAGVGIFAGRSLAERSEDTSLPAQVPAPGGGWYRGVAAPEGRAFRGDGPTDCGHVLTTESLGVAHAVLPCDAKLYIRLGDRMVLTQVLAHGPRVAAHDFELTPALARRLGLRSPELIAWRYSR